MENMSITTDLISPLVAVVEEKQDAHLVGGHLQDVFAWCYRFG